MYEQSRQFFERYDYFVLPVTQVAPFDVNVPYPTQIAGTPMATYIDWMRSCWYVTFMANPAISVPAGSRRAGCPSGCRSSAGIATSGACCRSAHAFEQATQHGKRRPPVSERVIPSAQIQGPWAPGSSQLRKDPTCVGFGTPRARSTARRT